MNSVALALCCKNRSEDSLQPAARIFLPTQWQLLIDDNNRENKEISLTNQNNEIFRIEMQLFENGLELKSVIQQSVSSKWVC